MARAAHERWRRDHARATDADAVWVCRADGGLVGICPDRVLAIAGAATSHPPATSLATFSHCTRERPRDRVGIACLTAPAGPWQAIPTLSSGRSRSWRRTLSHHLRRHLLSASDMPALRTRWHPSSTIRTGPPFYAMASWRRPIMQSARSRSCRARSLAPLQAAMAAIALLHGDQSVQRLPDQLRPNMRRALVGAILSFRKYAS